MSRDKIKQKIAEIGRRNSVPYDRVQTLFLLERAAARLSADPVLKDHLVFKGGFVQVRVYGSPRFTTDLDATLSGLAKDEARDRIPRALYGDDSVVSLPAPSVMGEGCSEIREWNEGEHDFTR